MALVLCRRIHKTNAFLFYLSVPDSDLHFSGLNFSDSPAVQDQFFLISLDPWCSFHYGTCDPACQQIHEKMMMADTTTALTFGEALFKMMLTLYRRKHVHYDTDFNTV